MKFRNLLLAAAFVSCGFLAAAPAVKVPTPAQVKSKGRPRKAAAPLYECTFAKGGWKSSDWTMIRSWRFNYDGQWIQKANCIENKVPADATKYELLSKRAPETYTAMILNKKFKGNSVTSCTMEFDDRMAPGIIIAAEPEKGKYGKLEFREHFEVILYDDGLNVWHHYFENGKQKWRKQHYLLDKKSFKPQKRYNITTKITFTGRGPYIELLWNNRAIGYYEPQMMKFKDNYRIGIVGCEGLNRFYDFKVTNR